MSDRDPRTDPRRGDGVQGGDLKIRFVRQWTGTKVAYYNGRGHLTWAWLEDWRAWAKGAVVLEKGEDSDA